MAEELTAGSEITRLLHAWDGGDQAALARIIPLMIDDLRHISYRQIARERTGHTLQPTALVNELFLRWSRQERFGWRDRAHFLKLAAAQMRRILVEHARKKQAQKRGAGLAFVMSEIGRLPDPASYQDPIDVLDLDRALDQLGALDPRYSRIVELRYFAGLTVREVAEVLGITERTVMRHWAWIRAWLFTQLSTGDRPAS